MPRFRRTRPAPTVRGGYAAYRPHVRSDFEKTCAYCLLQELWAGGEENFELDHFKPRNPFTALIKDFYNLYWSCHPCNHIKWGYWPSEELQEQGIGFVDLCQDDFETHFVEKDDGTWEGLTPSARYTIDVLNLNRPHLKEIRRRIRDLGESAAH
jgi:uncharacterized protein (TIGR02646 family)